MPATARDLSAPPSERRLLRAAPPLVVAGLLVAVYAPTLGWLVHRWSLGVWYHSHGFLVAPIALFLAWRVLRGLGPLPATASAWGFVFLVPALLLQIVDAALRFEILSALSLVLIAPGLCLLFLGPVRTRAVWFPLFCLAFMIPVPKLVAEQVHLVLRQVSAVATEHTLGFIGYDVVREQTTLHLPFGSVQIADACSGFNALLVTVFAGCLLVYLGVTGWWRRLPRFATILPAAVLANIVRCTVLVILIGGFDAGILNTWVHDFSGVCTFLCALLLLIGVEAAVRPKRHATAAEAGP
ncbi:MAG: exosortase/archaeosortase family protein [Planctomycetota bacterium]